MMGNGEVTLPKLFDNKGILWEIRQLSWGYQFVIGYFNICMTNVCVVISYRHFMHIAFLAAIII